MTKNDIKELIELHLSTKQKIKFAINTTYNHWEIIKLFKSLRREQKIINKLKRRLSNE